MGLGMWALGSFVRARMRARAKTVLPMPSVPWRQSISQGLRVFAIVAAICSVWVCEFDVCSVCFIGFILTTDEYG